MSLVWIIDRPAWYIRNVDLCSVRIVLRDVPKRQWGRINILMGRIRGYTSHCLFVSEGKMTLGTFYTHS